MRLRHQLTLLAGLSLGSVAHAQTGVSDDRVSLPEGPGSLEGIGENISLNPNMGVMSYGVPIDVPRGFPGVTPSLRLGYSSGGGSGVVGVGWSLSIPHIERSTFRGLPEYTTEDRFSADGGTQLVRLPGDGVPTYRARFEGGFARYTWQEVGDGTEGYWQVEYPDGRVATFGATADGTLVPSARVSGPDGTFRYMIVDMVDPHGHRLNHTYQSIDGFALIRQMDYVFTDDAPEYSVSFSYEDRADDGGVDILSDAKAGFDERLTQRVAAINVFSGENRIRRYDLTYEPYAESGGFTRLSSVSTLGLDGSTYPAVQRFDWSRSLEGVCNEGDDCTRPFVIDMGNIGVNIGVGRATLIDINGDALPDLVDTSDDGAHTFRLNVPSIDGQARFSDVPIASAIGEGSGFRLGTPFVQVLDFNGDGYADLLDARNGRALVNTGTGDWDRLQPLADTAAVGDALGADFGEGGLSTLRFVDIDNDKRIDLMRSTRQETRIFNNRGEDGFVILDDADILGYDLGVDGIQMTDMNGDGLLDAVKLNVGGLRYRLNYGRGRWGEEVEVLGLPIDESELDLASLDDLNGDGLADLVVVVGRTVKFAINRNGTVFSQITTLDSPAVDGDLPQRDATVSVIMADVNGNGSTDVVWLDAQGQVTALEMFPVRPNQLARVSNSLGMVTTINYTTSVQEMARDGDWQFTLPHPMQVVSSVEQSDGATGINQITRYRYRDGYYDGEEKQFRGFGHVETRTEADDFTEAGLTVMTYDLGVEDRYRHGRTLTMAQHSGDRLLSTLENVYDDYSRRIKVVIDPQAATDEAGRAVLTTLHQNFMRNLPGVLGDLDAEFLKDLRVAVRRTRAALWALRPAWRRRTIEPLQAGLKWLGEVTTPVRDLDVYLQRLPVYQGELSPDLQPALDPLGGLLRTLRVPNQAAMVRALTSPGFAAIEAQWTDFLTALTPSTKPAGRLPIVDIARGRTAAIYTALCAQGRAITPESPAEALHALRKTGKKLRYLLEFFRTVHPPAHIKPAIKHMRRLQAHLGEFNDVSIQYTALAGHAAQLKACGAPSQTTRAVNQLIKQLEAREAAERLNFEERWTAFDSLEVQALFADLLAPSDDASAPQA